MPYTLQPGSKNVFHGVRHDVWQWEQKMFDGTTQTFECTTRKDHASIIAFLDPDTILLTEQIQAGRDDVFIDIPGGVIEPGESPEETARREFLEETGYEIGKLELYKQNDFKGSSRLSAFIYLATDLKNGRTQSLDAGEKITLKPTPFEDAVRLSLKGGMRQTEVMLALVTLRHDEDAQRKLEEFLSK
jgi:ADP-ribose pyrophosphatase